MNIRMDLSLQGKILAGYAILVAVVIGIAAILVHERQRIREIEAGTEEKGNCRILRQKREGTDNAIRRGAVPVQRQSDSYAAETDKRNGRTY